MSVWSGMDDLFTISPRGLATPLASHKPFLYAFICLLWLLPGLLGRDPWHPHELILTPVVSNMVNDGLSWMPSILGEPFVKMPPLYLWLASFSAQATAWFLPVHEGARLINIVLLAVGLLFIRLCAGRYGALAGWVAVLLAVGTTGLMVKAHLLNASVAAFAGGGALLWGVLRLHTHAVVGGMTVGLAIGFLFMSVGVTSAAAAVLALSLLMMRRYSWWRRPWDGLATAMVFALPGLLIWPLILVLVSPDWFSLWLEQAVLPSAFSVSSFLYNVFDLIKTLSWSLFPVLPIVIFGLWFLGWNYAFEQTVFLCLCLLAAGSLLFLFKGGNEEDLFFVLPALSVAAALALQRLPNDAAVVLDWFAMLIVGLCCIGLLWFLWLCLQTGAPAVVFDYIDSLYPDQKILSMPSYWGVGFAAVMTILWVSLIMNFGLSNERAVVNWSSGVAMVWLLFNVLWVDYVDSGKSYRRVAESVKLRLDGECLQKNGISLSLLAQMDYFGVTVGGDKCRFFLANADSQAETGELIWEGGRPGKRQYLLYRRF